MANRPPENGSRLTKSSAAGQYHWVAVSMFYSNIYTLSSELRLTFPPVSPSKWMPLLSWMTGWVNCAGWVALTATGGLLGSQLVVGIIALMNPVRITCPKNPFEYAGTPANTDIRTMKPKTGINSSSISATTLPALLSTPPRTVSFLISTRQPVSYSIQSARLALAHSVFSHLVAERIHCYLYHRSLLLFSRFQLCRVSHASFQEQVT